MNFSADSIAYSLPGGLQPAKLVLANLGSTEAGTSTLHLQGREARVYKF